MIYKVSLNTIADHPWTGFGTDRFSSAYHLHQAAYFRANTNSEYARLADSIRIGYNELLQLGIETGMVGMLLALSCIILFWGGYSVLRREQPPMLWGYYGVVVATLITSLFSYPFLEVSLTLLFVFAAAVIGYHLKGHRPILTFSHTMSRVAYGAVIAAVLLLGLGLFHHFDAKYKWQKAAQAASEGRFNETLYDSLYQHYDFAGGIMIMAKESFMEK